MIKKTHVFWETWNIKCEQLLITTILQEQPHVFDPIMHLWVNMVTFCSFVTSTIGFPDPENVVLATFQLIQKLRYYKLKFNGAHFKKF